MGEEAAGSGPAWSRLAGPRWPETLQPASPAQDLQTLHPISELAALGFQLSGRWQADTLQSQLHDLASSECQVRMDTAEQAQPSGTGLCPPRHSCERAAGGENGQPMRSCGTGATTNCLT